MSACFKAFTSVCDVALPGKSEAQPLRPSSDASAWAAAAELHTLLGNDDLAQGAFVGHVARCFTAPSSGRTHTMANSSYLSSCIGFLLLRCCSRTQFAIVK